MKIKWKVNWRVFEKVLNISRSNRYKIWYKCICKILMSIHRPKTEITLQKKSIKSNKMSLKEASSQEILRDNSSSWNRYKSLFQLQKMIWWQVIYLIWKDFTSKSNLQLSNRSCFHQLNQIKITMTKIYRFNLNRFHQKPLEIT